MRPAKKLALASITALLLTACTIKKLDEDIDRTGADYGYIQLRATFESAHGAPIHLFHRVY